MQSFTSLRAIAAGVPIANIDTDMLCSAAFLKTVSRRGLSSALLYSLRRDPDFTLNQPPWNTAGILVALDNFGCGSSREHAPWALLDFGIRCVIAPSFADIFYGNCFKNGILPITLDAAVVEVLLKDAGRIESATLTIDLMRQVVTRASGEEIGFTIDPQRRERLLNGVDEIGMTLRLDATIGRYEAESRRERPWYRPIPADFLLGSEL